MINYESEFTLVTIKKDIEETRLNYHWYKINNNNITDNSASFALVNAL